MKDYFLKVWAKITGAYYTWEPIIHVATSIWSWEEVSVAFTYSAAIFSLNFYSYDTVIRTSEAVNHNGDLIGS